MSSLFGRVRAVVVAEAHEALEHFEDPQAMSHQLLRELAADLAGAQGALVAALGAQRGLERQREELGQQAARWESRAELVLRSGEEPLAREAMGRALALAQSAAALEPSVQTAQRAAGRVRSRVERLRAELERVRARVVAIEAQQAAALSLRRATGAGGALARAFERAAELERHERKAAAQACQAEAADELLDGQERLERSVTQLEADLALDQAMARLRLRIVTPASSTEAASQPEKPA